MKVQFTENPVNVNGVDIRSWRLVSPRDDPGLQQRIDHSNAFANNVVKLLTGVQPIEKLSIEEASLICSLGLPGAEDLNITETLNTFKSWVDHVRIDTEHWMSQYCARPEEFGSLARFQCEAMMTVVQKYLGAEYNHSFSQGAYDPRDSRDLFIHGLLSGHGGACVSMPTLLCAIGRRLGYPLFMVQAKEHTFIRWDDPATGERFNFDGTSPGFTPHNDEYYMNQPVPLSIDDLILFPRYLKNMATRSEELALMLGERGHCLMYNLRSLEATIAFQYAVAADPDNRLLKDNWAISTMLHEAFIAAQNKAISKDRTHYPLRYVRIQPSKTPWKKVAYRTADRVLFELRKLYPENHSIRIE